VRACVRACASVSDADAHNGNHKQAAKEAEKQFQREQQAQIDRQLASRRAEKEELAVSSFLEARSRHNDSLSSSLSSVLPAPNALGAVAGSSASGGGRGRIAGMQIEENSEDDPGGEGDEVGRRARHESRHESRHEWGLAPTAFEMQAQGKLGLKGGAVEGGEMLFKRSSALASTRGIDGGDSAGGLADGGAPRVLTGGGLESEGVEGGPKVD
jgi:hypothetical protein